MSVGIIGGSGALVAAINVSGLTQRLSEAARRRAFDRMRDVVDEIEAALRDGARRGVAAAVGPPACALPPCDAPGERPMPRDTGRPSR